jgi:two-component sensor histidine kinase
LATGALEEERQTSGYSIKAVLGLMVAVLSLFLAVLGYSIYMARVDAERRAMDRAFAASQVVSTNAFWITELSQQALRRIDEALGPDIERRRAGAALNMHDAVDNLPGIVKAYVVDAEGRTIYTTDPEIKSVDIRDRPYFSSLAAGAPWHISHLLISRLNGEQIFVYSRRLERGGAFVGAAIISFDVRLFRDIWRSLTLDDDSAISLVRGDGMLVARYPFAKEATNLSSADLFTRHLPAADQGTYRTIPQTEASERFVGYHRVTNSDLVAIASISSAAAFAPFWRTARTTAYVVVPTLIVLIGASIWLLRLMRRDAERQKALADALETNQMLLRDIHHRVKNNLQSVQSLVRMQTIPADVKADLQARIAAMSAVHEHLYRLDQYTEVDAHTLIPAIVEPLVESSGRDIDVAFQVDRIEVDRDHATPLALLVNELVTNSIKYAFPGRRKGHIRIGLEAVDAWTCRLMVSDDGVGFDPETVKNGMGSRLIRAMAMQLQGDWSYEIDNGTTYNARLQVKVPPKDQPARAAVKVAAE